MKHENSNRAATARAYSDNGTAYVEFTVDGIGAPEVFSMSEGEAAGLAGSLSLQGDKGRALGVRLSPKKKTARK